MNMRTLEEVLVEQCAPTLARVKPASMFRYQPRDLKAEPLEQALEKLPALRDMLAARGIRVRILKNCPKTETLLFFVFRTELCGRILEDRAVRAFLRAGGYDAERGIDAVLDQFSERICQEELSSLVTLRRIAAGLSERTQQNYRTIMSFNTGLILLGVAGIFAPQTAALLHNLSTLAIGMHSMTDLLPAMGG